MNDPFDDMEAKAQYESVAAHVAQLEAENAALSATVREYRSRMTGPDGVDWNGVATLEHERLIKAKADLARLTAAVTTYCSDAVKAYLQPRDVVALAEAHAEDSQTVDKLEDDLSRARAVLDSATVIDITSVMGVRVVVDRAAWQAWKKPDS